MGPDDEPMTPWPASASPRAGNRFRVGVVTANWNTRDLLARMLYGVLRVVEPGTIAEVVVVDNGSSDGSVALARALADAGVIHLIANTRQRYHGPALTQGVNLLSGLARERPIDLVWALDSDVLVLRADVVAAAAAALADFDAVLAADPDDYAPGPPRAPTDTLAVCSTLFDPAVVWQSRHRPFLEDGQPSRHLQADLVSSGHRLLEFPFCSAGYVLHIGRSTLANVDSRGARDNRFRSWAVDHNEPHFALRPDGPELLARFESGYRAAVPDDSTGAIVAALSRGL